MFWRTMQNRPKFGRKFFYVFIEDDFQQPGYDSSRVLNLFLEIIGSCGKGTFSTLIFSPGQPTHEISSIILRTLRRHVHCCA
jgi:hypothetical protein